MLQNFLKIAARHFWRTRTYACINVFGLAIGLTTVLFATIYIADENSFDDFHNNNPHLHRITTRFTEPGNTRISGGTGQVQGPAFQSAIPEITRYARIMGGDIYGDIRNENKVFKMQMLFVDSSFFQVFSFKMLFGNPVTALRDVNSVVITKKAAQRFFGRLNVVGEILQMDADPSAQRLGKPLIISGVVEDPPANSSIQFDALFPFAFLNLSFEDTTWLNAYLSTFVVLRSDADTGKVIRQFNQIGKTRAVEQMAQYRKEHEKNVEISYALQPMTEIHLAPLEVENQNREAGIVNASKPVYSVVFLTIAAFILLMASINFINISTSVSIRRAKEIGVRKVTGSSRRDIFFQFIGESSILSLVAFSIALLAAALLLPVFNELSGKQLSWKVFLASGTIGWLGCILVVNILLSGAYPAYLLSGFSPVKILRGAQPSPGLLPAGRVLAVIQFTIAIILGISSLVFQQQMHFIRSKDLGYRPEQVMRIPVSGVRDVQQIRNNFESALKINPFIDRIALTGDFGFRETKVGLNQFMSYYRTIDGAYLQMLKMHLKAGRGPSVDSQSDAKRAVVVNEAFVKTAGLAEPVGATLQADSYFGSEPLTIIGVVENFHFASLKDRIQPLVMPVSTVYGGDALLISTSVSERKQAIAAVQKSYRKFLPHAAFTYTFLDEENAKRYQQEQRWQQIITYATGISMLICCLGLFGLAHLSIFQRKKETAIRLVLGATFTEIVVLFSGGFVRNIGVAFLIASPLAYYLLSGWLAHFAYRIAFPWWALPASGTAAVLVALATVGSQGMRAAAANPAVSLRSE